ncbi:MAG: DNA primase [Bacteroidales bacterium]|nr:DNA primase [Bacteroidales bacterium]
MIPQETVDLILNTAKIEEVVGDYVTLKRRGASYVACCPFHNEKTPSFYVTPSKGIYKCFGCGKAGTAVGFVMEQEHCDYPEALRYLARKYHIEIVEEEESPELLAARQRKESLLLATEYANKFFVDQLSAPEGRAMGYAYYKSRGLEDETIRKFSLGWAPSGGSALMNAATAAGYKQEYLLEAGLLAQKEDTGAVVDKFRERVMFPIYSVSGRVIAFSGRTLKADNPAKYVNSPDTPLYNKSEILYGLFQAKSEIGRQNKCIVVEGNLDMVMMHQLGITNVVAPCGTSFTTQQMHLIHKFTDNLTVMFDGDSAGIHAALKVMEDVLSEGLNMKVVLLPEGEDPDSFCRKHTLLQVQAYIEEHEKDCIDFKTDWLLKEAGSDPLRRAGVISAVSDTIAAIPDAIKRSTYAERFAARMGVDKEEIVQRRVKATRSKAIEDAERRREREGARPGSADEAPTIDVTLAPGPSYPIENKTLAPIEAEILGFLLMDGDKDVLYEDEQIPLPEFVSEILARYGEPFSNSVYQRLYEAFMAQYDAVMPETDPGDEGRSTIREKALGQIIQNLLNIQDEDLNKAMQDLAFEKHKITFKKLSGSMRATGDWLKHAVPKSMFTLVEKRLTSQIENLNRKLADVPKDDEEGLMEIMEKLKDLSQERTRIRKLIKEKIV